MALTYTPAGELGSSCPQFSLPSVDGRRFQLQDFASSRILIIAFICNQCPYVQAIEDRLIQLGQQWPLKDVALVGICANDPEDYPEDAPSELLKKWRDKNYGFPYLIDDTQTVAKTFGAVCTPDFFVYDSNRRLAYRGRLDDSWRNPDKVKRQEMKEAIQTLLKGASPSISQNPAMGCSIKWKKGG